MPQGRKLLTELIRLVEFAEREELWEAGDLLAPMVEMLAPRLANRDTPLLKSAVCATSPVISLDAYRENIQAGKTT